MSSGMSALGRVHLVTGELEDYVIVPLCLLEALELADPAPNVYSPICTNYRGRSYIPSSVK